MYIRCDARSCGQKYRSLSIRLADLIQVRRMHAHGRFWAGSPKGVGGGGLADAHHAGSKAHAGRADNAADGVRLSSTDGPESTHTHTHTVGRRDPPSREVVGRAHRRARRSFKTLCSLASRDLPVINTNTPYVLITTYTRSVLSLPGSAPPLPPRRSV